MSKIRLTFLFRHSCVGTGSTDDGKNIILSCLSTLSMISFPCLPRTVFVFFFILIVCSLLLSVNITCQLNKVLIDVIGTF